VWDLESKESKEEDESWENYKARAGVGVAVIYDEDFDIWEVYGHRDLVELVKRLEGAEEVVSYNGVGFDHVVVDQAVGRRVWIQKETDLWIAIKEMLGPEKWPKGSWTLSEVCQRTIGRGKTGTGVSAPSQLAQGDWAKVTSYCVNDVKLTRDLWRFVREFGYVVDPDGRKRQVGQ
jgi:DEAD/DEAH box helicase domain-containing protein